MQHKVAVAQNADRVLTAQWPHSPNATAATGWASRTSPKAAGPVHTYEPGPAVLGAELAIKMPPAGVPDCPLISSPPLLVLVLLLLLAPAPAITCRARRKLAAILHNSVL